ncbi:selenoprotein M [Halyomorpha halys]|uniref:selenoprotein M n=1 Tax=Halyomorpha halys TaxID=286706 RepID=UPI0006D4E622|nr:selenoprotein M-like [Halyomorpha halys]
MGNIINSSGGSPLVIVLLCILLHLAISSEPELDRKFSKAEIQSCSGCSLNRLPEVRAFIFEDVPNYEDAEFKHIQGAQPELVLYSHDHKEVDRIPLRDLSRKQCNALLKEKGFAKKSKKVEKEL